MKNIIIVEPLVDGVVYEDTREAWQSQSKLAIHLGWAENEMTYRMAKACITKKVKGKNVIIGYNQFEHKNVLIQKLIVQVGES